MKALEKSTGYTEKWPQKFEYVYKWRICYLLMAQWGLNTEQKMAKRTRWTHSSVFKAKEKGFQGRSPETLTLLGAQDENRTRTSQISRDFKFFAPC